MAPRTEGSSFGGVGLSYGTHLQRGYAMRILTGKTLLLKIRAADTVYVDTAVGLLNVDRDELCSQIEVKGRYEVDSLADTVAIYKQVEK